MSDGYVDPNYHGHPADYPLYLRLLAERDRLPAELRPQKPDPEGRRNLAALEAALAERDLIPPELRGPDPEGPRNLAELDAAISTRLRKRAS
ncbi:hypothetical protein ACIGO7_07550 [Streptomyces virginiae]|uniref:hypothetical protein n=1 Tax=Streptomyces virginiae TaxID=1961 RepID=UPI00344DFFB7